MSVLRSFRTQRCLGSRLPQSLFPRSWRNHRTLLAPSARAAPQSSVAPWLHRDAPVSLALAPSRLSQSSCSDRCSRSFPAHASWCARQFAPARRPAGSRLMITSTTRATPCSWRAPSLLSPPRCSVASRSLTSSRSPCRVASRWTSGRSCSTRTSDDQEQTQFRFY